MGKRISYFKNNFGKGLKDLIFENFSSFRQWYLATDKSSIEEFNEPIGNENLKSYLKQNTNLKLDFDNLDKNLIDELTAEFIGSYCDSLERNNNLLEFFGPNMSNWRYEQSSEMVLATKDEDFIKLWNYIIKGRSLKDNTNFNSYENDYKIGFLGFNEQRLLKEKIETYFGDIEIMKQKYWTEKEKKELENAIASSKNSSYSLSGHNPKSSGLEYVLQVLNKVADSKNEIIIGIE